MTTIIFTVLSLLFLFTAFIGINKDKNSENMFHSGSQTVKEHKVNGFSFFFFVWIISVLYCYCCHSPEVSGNCGTLKLRYPLFIQLSVFTV